MEKIKQAYKQTDIGLIPVDWEVYEIEDICKSIVRGPFGGALKKEYFVDFGYKVYEQRNAIYQNVNIGRYYIDCDKFSALKRFVINYKDFIVSCSGTIGRIYQIPKQYEKGIINQALLKLTIDEIKCDNKYFYYVFVSNEFQQKIIDSTQGGAMKNLVGMPIFKKTPFALPKSISEQTAIATALSDTDALIAALDKKIAKKQQIKQGTMQQLLTGKKRLPGFGGEWVEKKLGELLDYEQPTNYIVKSTDYLTQGIPVLTAGKSFILGYTAETTGIFTNSPVIIFDDFTTATKFVDFKFKVKSSAMKILKLRESNNSIKLIYELMQLIDFPLIDHQRYWISEYSKIIVKIPATSEEQNAIAQILTDMDNEIVQLEKERDKYKEIKAGMMQVLLTGKIRLI